MPTRRAVLLFSLALLLTTLTTSLAASAGFDAINTPILQMAYFPPDPNDANYLDLIETDLNGPLLISEIEAATNAMVAASLPFLSDSTRYHHGQNPSAPPYLDFSVVDSLVYYEKMPTGTNLGRFVPDGQRSATITLPSGHTQEVTKASFRPNYGLMLNNIDICDYVDNDGVREVWLYGYHGPTIVPDESKMSSRYGDVSNALPKDEFVNPAYRLPLCNNSYVLYNFTYQPGGANAIANTIHNRLHQIENVIWYAEGRGYNPNPSAFADSTFWDDFSWRPFGQDMSNFKSSCGNAHSPPNTFAGYDYGNTAFAVNNCSTWHPNDSQTTYVNQNCDVWGCTDLGFYKWFMQNVPGYEHGITLNGCVLRNWWDAMVDFNAFMDAQDGLFRCVQNRLLHLPFDGSLNGVDGEMATSNGVTYAAGNSGQGVLIDGNDSLTYARMGNHNLAQGEISFWIQPQWNGDDNQPHTFLEIGSSFFNRMRITKDGANNLRFMLWSTDTEYNIGVNIGDWQAGEWHFIKAEWNNDHIALFVDEERAGFATNGGLPATLPNVIYIGSTFFNTEQADAVIDQFKIKEIAVGVATAVELSGSDSDRPSAENALLPVVMFLLIPTAIYLQRSRWLEIKR